MVMCQGDRKPCWTQLWLYWPLKGGNLAHILIGATCSLLPSLICFSTELPPVLGMCRNTWSSASWRGRGSSNHPCQEASRVVNACRLQANEVNKNMPQHVPRVVTSSRSIKMLFGASRCTITGSSRCFGEGSPFFWMMGGLNDDLYPMAQAEPGVCSTCSTVIVATTR